MRRLGADLEEKQEPRGVIGRSAKGCQHQVIRARLDTGRDREADIRREKRHSVSQTARPKFESERSPSRYDSRNARAVLYKCLRYAFKAGGLPPHGLDEPRCRDPRR